MTQTLKITALQCYVLGQYIHGLTGEAKVAEAFETTEQVIKDAAKTTDIRRRLVHEQRLDKVNQILNEFGDAVEVAKNNC